MLVESSAVLGRGCGVPVSAERIMGTVEGGGCGEIGMGSIPGAGTHLYSTAQIRCWELISVSASFSRFNKS